MLFFFVLLPDAYQPETPASLLLILDSESPHAGGQHPSENVLSGASAMLARHECSPGHGIPRSKLHLATRLALARTGSVRLAWTSTKRSRPNKKSAKRHRLGCNAKEASQSTTLRCARHLLTLTHETACTLSTHSQIHLLHQGSGCTAGGSRG